MVILITYDLNKPGKDYSKLHEAIKNISGIWWHDLTSVWLVETHFSAKQVSERLLPLIDTNDEIFVIRVFGDYSGWLPQRAWDWLRSKTY